MTHKYADRPDLPLQVVKTITGDKEYRKNCRRKDGLWFAIDVDIAQVEGKWYKTTDTQILFDHHTKQYGLTYKVQSNCAKGIVGYNKDTKEFIFGYFTRDPYNNCVVSKGVNKHSCINAEVLAGTKYKEDVATGTWIENGSAEIATGKGHSDKGYNIEDNGYERLIKLYIERPYKLNLNHAKIAHLLKDTTFGIELEACAGNTPQYMLNRYGCTICRDGSLVNADGAYPPEYVTVPLSGAKGITNTIELTECLKSRNLVDLKCAYHLHLGNINTSRQFIVALHSLCYKIQGNVFKMFPHYKLKPDGIKGKNYCKLLPKTIKQYKSGEDYTEYINTNYKRLFKYCTEYQAGDETKKVEADRNFNRKTKAHNGKAKWSKLARYHWLNMCNIFFSERNTVEFRLHTPTFNATKIINWLLICNAICRYAEKYPLQCIDSTKITFTEVLSYYQRANSNSEYNHFVSNYLQAYVEERTQMFKLDKKKKDLTSDHELQSDKDYTFTYNGKQLLQC